MGEIAVSIEPRIAVTVSSVPTKPRPRDSARPWTIWPTSLVSCPVAAGINPRTIRASSTSACCVP